MWGCDTEERAEHFAADKPLLCLGHLLGPPEAPPTFPPHPPPHLLRPHTENPATEESFSQSSPESRRRKKRWSRKK